MECEDVMKNKTCPVAKKCSGCQLSNLDYQQQLEFKQKDVEKLLRQFGEVKPIVAMENPYNYRNKVQAIFRSDRSGRIISGVFQSARNGIVGVDRCFLNDEKADEKRDNLLKTIDDIREKYGYNTVKKAILLSGDDIAGNLHEDDDFLPFKKD